MILKKVIIFLFILNIVTFALEIDSIKFDKKLKKNTKISKIFSLRNDSNENKTYHLSIEENEDVNIKPKILNISPFKKKEFFIEVNGKQEGKGQYYLVINETNPSFSKKEKGLKLIKTIKILQKYTVM